MAGIDSACLGFQIFDGRHPGREHSVWLEPRLSGVRPVALLRVLWRTVPLHAPGLQATDGVVDRLIILPIAGNACEHITAVLVAYKDKMDLSIGVCSHILPSSSPAFDYTQAVMPWCAGNFERSGSLLAARSFLLARVACQGRVDLPLTLPMSQLPSIPK